VKKIDVGGVCILNSDCNQPLVAAADYIYTSADSGATWDPAWHFAELGIRGVLR
jgi:hypothetical protein